MSVAEVKTLLTVPEAAKALRIGRSTAYDLAHAWLDSGGTKGLPVVVIGGSLRVPLAALERLFALGGFGPAWQSGLDGRRSPRSSPAVPDAGDPADAGSTPGEPSALADPETDATSGTSGASEPTLPAAPQTVGPSAPATESAPPQPTTPKPRRPRRSAKSSSAQLSLFDLTVDPPTARDAG